MKYVLLALTLIAFAGCSVAVTKPACKYYKTHDGIVEVCND